MIVIVTVIMIVMVIVIVIVIMINNPRWFSMQFTELVKQSRVRQCVA